MAFTQASVKPGGEVLKKGMDILKAGMMGQFPSSEVIAAVKAENADLASKLLDELRDLLRERQP